MSLPEGAPFNLGQSQINDHLDLLAKEDEGVLNALEQFGYPEERRSPGGFPALLRIVVGQQLSVKAAASIAARLDDAMGGEKSPDCFLSLDDETLRGVGLSRSKIAYGRGIAEAVLDGRLKPNELHQLSDEEVVEQITACKGLGIWSARIYLMFSLGRADIWPADDLGVREGVRRIRQLDMRPSVREADELGARWAPYRSSAALLCWHILNNAPT